jgi:hypothetical protein
MVVRMSEFRMKIASNQQDALQSECIGKHYLVLTYLTGEPRTRASRALLLRLH